MKFAQKMIKLWLCQTCLNKKKHTVLFFIRDIQNLSCNFLGHFRPPPHPVCQLLSFSDTGIKNR
jgi:hypothetical protein